MSATLFLEKYLNGNKDVSQLTYDAIIEILIEYDNHLSITLKKLNNLKAVVGTNTEVIVNGDYKSVVLEMLPPMAMVKTKNNKMVVWVGLDKINLDG